MGSDDPRGGFRCLPGPVGRESPSNRASEPFLAGPGCSRVSPREPGSAPRSARSAIGETITAPLPRCDYQAVIGVAFAPKTAVRPKISNRSFQASTPPYGGVGGSTERERTTERGVPTVALSPTSTSTSRYPWTYVVIGVVVAAVIVEVAAAVLVRGRRARGGGQP